MFSDLFTYEGITFTENRVIYTDVIIIDDDIDWEYGDGEIEAVLDVANGVFYFGEYDTDTQVYNKSRNFYINL
jgi:hypothetical protein